MTLKETLFDKAFAVVRASRFYYGYRLKDDERKTSPFKLVFFCGAKGIDYLNASLISVYKTWTHIPELFIVSDGTPANIISQKMLRWPRNVEITDWSVCAGYFKEKGDTDFYEYAQTELWGRKFAAIHYCASRFPALYSDTDVLWYSTPALAEDISNKPVMKMSQDAMHCYTESVIEALGEERCMETTPLNAGLMYIHGDFSSYPKWKELGKYLAENKALGGFSEQTANAIINNHFNADNYWGRDRVLITVADATSLRYSYRQYPQIWARHYVSTKRTAFWRDFIYKYLQK